MAASLPWIGQARGHFYAAYRARLESLMACIAATAVYTTVPPRCCD